MHVPCNTNIWFDIWTCYLLWSRKNEYELIIFSCYKMCSNDDDKLDYIQQSGTWLGVRDEMMKRLQLFCIVLLVCLLQSVCLSQQWYGHLVSPVFCVISVTSNNTDLQLLVNRIIFLVSVTRDTSHIFNYLYGSHNLLYTKQFCGSFQLKEH